MVFLFLFSISNIYIVAFGYRFYCFFYYFCYYYFYFSCYDDYQCYPYALLYGSKIARDGGTPDLGMMMLRYDDGGGALSFFSLSAFPP